MLQAEGAITKLNDRTFALDRFKIDVAAFDEKFKEVTDGFRKLTVTQQATLDDIASMENWVEKYLPLKLQHQISETVGEVITLDQRKRFYEISRQMAKVLRQEIIKDKGHSLLKKKCLDLITHLRLEE